MAEFTIQKLQKKFHTLDCWSPGEDFQVLDHDVQFYVCKRKQKQEIKEAHDKPADTRTTHTHRVYRAIYL